MIPTIAVLAAIAMFAQDILGTLLTMAEAREKAVIAGVLDTVGWYAAILTTTWSVTALQGHSLSEKVWVLLLVSVANFIGSYTGVIIGKKILKRKEIKVPAPQI